MRGTPCSASWSFLRPSQKGFQEHAAAPCLPMAPGSEIWGPTLRLATLRDKIRLSVPGRFSRDLVKRISGDLGTPTFWKGHVEGWVLSAENMCGDVTVTGEGKPTQLHRIPMSMVF